MKVFLITDEELAFIVNDNYALSGFASEEALILARKIRKRGEYEL